MHPIVIGGLRTGPSSLRRPHCDALLCPDGEVWQPAWALRFNLGIGANLEFVKGAHPPSNTLGRGATFDIVTRQWRQADAMPRATLARASEWYEQELVFDD